MDSRFISINEKILLEYSNSTYTKDFYYDIVTNSNTKRKTFYVAYSESTLSNSNRDNAIERLDRISNQWYHLDVENTNANANIIINEEIEPIIPLRYNKLRIHFISGYTFDDISGFILNTHINDKYGEPINLLNFAFLVDAPNNVITMNPEPLYINSTYYNRYIELDLISPESLVTNNDYKFLANQLSNNVIDDNTLVYFDFFTISSINDRFIYTDTETHLTSTIVDKYKHFSLHIAEVGDYFEHHAKFKDSLPNEFISNMAEMNRIWNITHRLEVFEQIGMDMIRTDEIEKIQRTNFNKIFKFRPIIESSNNAYSFTIKYTCIFSDTTTNEQFYRSATLSHLNPKKYGINLEKLNVDSFSKYDLYHKPSQNTIFSTNLIESNNTNNIIVNHYIQPIELVDNLVIEIMPFTNVYEFKFKKSIANSLQFFISFISDDNEKLYIEDLEDENTDTSLYFKISEKNAEKIRSFKNKNFYIIGVNINGETTVLNKGQFKI